MNNITTAHLPLFMRLFNLVATPLSTWIGHSVVPSFKRLGKIAIPFWKSEIKWTAISLLSQVVGLLVANILTQVLLSYFYREMYDALVTQQASAFYLNLLLYLLGIVLATPIGAYFPFKKSQLAITWLEWLWENQLFVLLFTNLQVVLQKSTLDNVPQQVTADAKAFCYSCVGLMIDLLLAIGMGIAFFFVLYQIAPKLAWMVVCCAISGSLIAAWIGKAMPSLSINESKFDGQLRDRITTFLKDPALGSTQLAQTPIMESKTLVIQNAKNVMKCQAHLALFTIPYNLVGPLIPAAMIAPVFFHQGISLGAISQAGMAFSQVFTAASFVVVQYQGICGFFSNITRVGQIVE
jgi:vitamin B12/bleomycin/antimicrobial peptide transport system ATP-binding/permease protein